MSGAPFPFAGVARLRRRGRVCLEWAAAYARNEPRYGAGIVGAPRAAALLEARRCYAAAAALVLLHNDPRELARALRLEERRADREARRVPPWVAP